MTPEQRQRMQQLIDQLLHHNRLYYTLGSPSISDSDYDALYDELLALERETGERWQESPTHHVGAPVRVTAADRAFLPHRHLVRLYSLDKCRSLEALREWEGRMLRQLFNSEALEKAVQDGLGERGIVEQSPESGLPRVLDYAVQPKLDGINISLTYRQGALVCAATRGDGKVGEDITAQARTIRALPKTIAHQGLIEVQGEAVMGKAAFAEYNENADISLKNMRNGAAGALRNLDTSETARRNLDVYCYGVGAAGSLEFTNYSDMLRFLQRQGFSVEAARPARGIEEAYARVQEVEAAREDYDYAIDGAVIKVERYSMQELLGHTDKFPRFAMAYKFKAEEAITTLKDVVWQVGRTGRLSPLALLSPVDVGGATVKKATLNNWDDIQRKGVAIGARVWLRRSGDVIPEILGRVEGDDAPTQAIRPPDCCPACGSAVAFRGVHLYCTGEDCPPQKVALLAHFVGRNAMDIRGLSEKTLATLLAKRGVRTAAQLYTLTEEQVRGLPGIADKKAAVLVAAIQGSKRPPLAKFLYALGIANVGSKTAEDIALRFGSLEGVWAARPEELEAMENVGPVVAASVRGYFDDPQNQALLAALAQARIQPQAPQRASAQGAFAGQVVVFTGGLSRLSRAQAQAEVTLRGGKCGSSITGKTTLVVAGEDAGSKLDKAREKGIPIWEEARFLRALEQQPG